MNKITKMLALTLPLTFCLQSGTASAAAEDIGILPSGGSLFTETETGIFDDIYKFTLLQNSHVLISYHDLQIDNGFGVNNEIPNLNADLSFFGGASIRPNLPENNTVSPFDLAAGDYQLHITGTPILAGFDHSTFSVGFNVAAVPEPETYALMLGGLALVGFSARRRKTELDA
jgi:hypothetical protein